MGIVFARILTPNSLHTRLYSPRVPYVTVPDNVIRIDTDTVTFGTHVETIINDRVEGKTSTDFVFLNFMVRITIGHDKIIERIGKPILEPFFGLITRVTLTTRDDIHSIGVFA